MNHLRARHTRLRHDCVERLLQQEANQDGRKAPPRRPPPPPPPPPLPPPPPWPSHVGAAADPALRDEHALGRHTVRELEAHLETSRERGEIPVIHADHPRTTPPGPRH